MSKRGMVPMEKTGQARATRRAPMRVSNPGAGPVVSVQPSGLGIAPSIAVQSSGPDASSILDARGGGPAAVAVDVTHKVRDTCLCLHVQRAARALARRYDEALRPVGLTSGQFSLLMALNRPHPPGMGQVSSLLAMDRTTLTANLKPLERRGLVAVAAGASDRRSRLLALTPAGRALLADALPIWERVQAEIGRRVEGQDPEPLLASLRSLS